MAVTTPFFTPATTEEWRAAYESKVQDFARETLRASRLRAALDAVEALDPNDFRTGQDHLPRAFREVNYKAVVLRISEIVDEAVAADKGSR